MYRRGARRMTMAGRGKEVGKRKLSLQRLTMSESPEALLRTYYRGARGRDTLLGVGDAPRAARTPSPGASVL